VSSRRTRIGGVVHRNLGSEDCHLKTWPRRVTGLGTRQGPRIRCHYSQSPGPGALGLPVLSVP
jgi:hypothetical protein